MESNNLLRNRQIYEARYTSASYTHKSKEDYFTKLFHIRLDLVQEIGRGKKILDAGCGSGSYLLPLCQDGYEVVGLDFSHNILKELKGIWKKSNIPGSPVLALGDVMRLPFKDNSFEAIFSFSVLYSIPRVDMALKEMYRVLIPGGIAAIDLGNRRSLNDIEAKRVWTGVESYHLKPSQMKRLIKESGFLIKDCRYFQIFPLYGGPDSFVGGILNPRLRYYLSKEVNGGLLDELISSFPLARAFCF